MSTYPLDELFRKWSSDMLSSEQAIGHMLQHLVSLARRQTELERQLAHAQAQVAPQSDDTSMSTHGGTPGL